MTRLRFYARGATLVELISFIIIVGVVVAGLFTAFAGILRSVGVPEHITQALELAQGRMELIVAQKHRLGFAAFDASTFVAKAGLERGTRALLSPVLDTTAPRSTRSAGLPVPRSRAGRT